MPDLLTVPLTAPFFVWYLFVRLRLVGDERLSGRFLVFGPCSPGGRVAGAESFVSSSGGYRLGERFRGRGVVVRSLGVWPSVVRQPTDAEGLSARRTIRCWRAFFEAAGLIGR
ncbi:hypothetical protein GCWU000246_00360 [Jonquetella anthropi E3_33 E1]|nr:hypothetical protein GCWU000246_01080 [Jonquetella anthropi E3_33 E1]EEX49026.1 hypothetical protein GCWU000246_00360 [Jonquetella anthropi E3_33 E1]